METSNERRSTANVITKVKASFSRLSQLLSPQPSPKKTRRVSTRGAIELAKRRQRRLRIEKGLPSVTEYWGTEVPLFYPTFYGGTADCVALWHDKPAILDFKQTNKPKKEEWIEDYYVQLAAYAMAHDALYKTEMQAGIILMASRGLSFQMFTIDGQRLDDYKYKWLKRCERYYNE